MPDPIPAESVDTEPRDDAVPIASRWHRRPDRSSLPCPYCGVRYQKPGVHRLVPDSDPPAWEQRRKSNTGWRIKRITPIPLPKTREERKKPPSEFEKQRFSHVVNSLAKHFIEEMRPRNADRWAYHTAIRYQASIAKLREFKGRDVAADEVTETMLNKFGQWLAGKGISAERTWDLQRRLRGIVIDWRTSHGLEAAEPEPEEPDPDPDSLTNVLALYSLKHRMGKGAHGMMRMTIKHFGQYLGHPPMTGDLTEDAVSAWLADLETRYSQATVAGYRIRILALWRTAAKRKFCPPPDTDEIRRCPPPEPFPVAWQVAEVNRLLAACNQMSGTTHGIPVGQKLRANILAAYDTGMRRSDLWNLRREQIRPDGTVFLQQRKTKRRHYPKMRPATVAAVLALPGEFPLRWGGRSMSFGNFCREWQKLRELAGISGDGSLHQLRRTGATHVAKKYGMDAARRYLGHKSPEMVFHYVDESIALQETYMPPELDTAPPAADGPTEPDRPSPTDEQHR